MASNCYMAGRIEPAIRYSDAAEEAISGGSDHVPYGAEGFLGAPYLAVGQPERWAKLCRARLARGLDNNTVTRGAWWPHCRLPVPLTRRWRPRTV